MTSKYRSGFTLLELLLFIVLASITTALLAAFLFRITRFSTANSVANSVDQGGAQMMSNLEFFLKDTEEILSPAMGTESQELSVRTVDDELITITVEDNQLLYENISTQESFIMNPDDTTVENVSFRPLAEIDPENLTLRAPATLSVTLSLAYTSPNISTDSFEYDYSKTYTKAISFRNTLKQLSVTDDLELRWRSDKNLVRNSSDGFSSWTDQIGGYQLSSLSGTTMVEDVNGTPAVLFNGVNSRIGISTIPTLPQGDSERTIIVVAQETDTSSSASSLLMDYGTTDALTPALTQFGIATKLDNLPQYGLRYTNDSFSESEIVPTQNISVLTARYNSSQASLSLNTSPLMKESDISLGTAGTALSIGGSLQNTHHFEGRVYEILVYSRALGIRERQAIYDYLNNKYSVSGNLE